MGFINGLLIVVSLTLIIMKASGLCADYTWPQIRIPTRVLLAAITRQIVVAVVAMKIGPKLAKRMISELEMDDRSSRWRASRGRFSTYQKTNKSASSLI